MLTWVVIGILGVWRITHLLHAEDGPWDLVILLRRRAGAGFWGSLLDCFYCLSIWAAAPFALLFGTSWREWLLLWPALSGGAILLERMTSRAQRMPAAYFEDEEKDDAVLREKERAVLRKRVEPR